MKFLLLILLLVSILSCNESKSGGNGGGKLPIQPITSGALYESIKGSSWGYTHIFFEEEWLEVDECMKDDQYIFTDSKDRLFGYDEGTICTQENVNLLKLQELLKYSPINMPTWHIGAKNGEEYVAVIFQNKIVITIDKIIEVGDENTVEVDITFIDIENSGDDFTERFRLQRF